jgi:hypothetical protein
MSAFKPQQRHLTIRGRIYHFVSYEGTPGNVKRQEPPQPAMWYLMVEGRRRAAFPCDPAQSLVDVDRALTRWVSANALAPSTPPIPEPSAAEELARRRRTSWWGPK